MLEVLTKLCHWFLGLPVLYSFLMPFAATPVIPAREWHGTVKSSSKIKTDIGPHFYNRLKYSRHEILHEDA